MAAKKYYIKERHNSQTGVYYVGEGQLTKKEAKKKENTLYGTNIMLSFDTKKEYEEALKSFNKKV